MSEWRVFAAGLLLFFAMQITAALVQDDPSFWSGVFLYRAPAFLCIFISIGIIARGVKRGA